MPMFSIIRTLLESDRISDFVAIGNLLNDSQESYHAAFIIKYEGSLQEFHYTGSDIELNNLISNDYFHKITNTIYSDEVPAFIAQCINVKKHANPIYGYFYSGESYDSDGNHNSKKNLGQRMTCVGFCLNVLKGFLEEDYIEYAGWDSISHGEHGYLEEYCKQYDIDPELIKDSHRRITPRECLTSCFFVELPIPKSKIQEKLIEVNHHFRDRFIKVSN